MFIRFAIASKSSSGESPAYRAKSARIPTYLYGPGTTLLVHEWMAYSMPSTICAGCRSYKAAINLLFNSNMVESLSPSAFNLPISWVNCHANIAVLIIAVLQSDGPAVLPGLLGFTWLREPALSLSAPARHQAPPDVLNCRRQWRTVT